MIPSASLAKWAALIKAAASNMKTELLDEEGFDSDDFDASVLYILRWLWCAQSDNIIPPCLGCRSDVLSSAFLQIVSGSLLQQLDA